MARLPHRRLRHALLRPRPERRAPAVRGAYDDALGRGRPARHADEPDEGAPAARVRTPAGRTCSRPASTRSRTRRPSTRPATRRCRCRSGLSDGLPVGMMIVGPHAAETTDLPRSRTPSSSAGTGGRRDGSDDASPLAGLQVVELDSPLTAFAGRLLWELGADVVLVEPRRGHRRAPSPAVPPSPTTTPASESLALDPSEPQDRPGSPSSSIGADVLLEAPALESLGHASADQETTGRPRPCGAHAVRDDRSASRRGTPRTWW